MSALLPGTPVAGASQSITAGAASSGITLTASTNQVQFWNAGSVLARYRTGVSAATATTSDTPIPPGAILVYTKPADHFFVAMITDTATTAVVHITPLEGN